MERGLKAGRRDVEEKEARVDVVDFHHEPPTRDPRAGKNPRGRVEGVSTLLCLMLFDDV